MKKIISITTIGIILPMFITTCKTFATNEIIQTQEITEIPVESRINNEQSAGSEDKQRQNTISNIQSTMSNNSSIGNINEIINVEDPFNIQADSSIATADKINTWVNFKASQLVSIIQTVGKWVAFIVFVICAMKTVAGVFGKSDNLSKGITAMIISAICFVAIGYADIIFQFLLNFIVT